jgi:hypothetical protein
MVTKELEMRRLCLGMLSAWLLGMFACGDDEGDLGQKFDSFVQTNGLLERTSCQCEGDTTCDDDESRELAAGRACIVHTLGTDPTAANAFLDCINGAVDTALSCLRAPSVCSSEPLRDACDERFEDQVDDVCWLPPALEEALDDCE